MLDVPDHLVKAATSLGGGIGLSKNICGTITAAALAVGLRFGSLEPTGKAPGPAYARTKAIMDRFKEQFGSTQCGMLTAQFVDFGSPARVYRCADFVGFVVDQLSEIIRAPHEDTHWREDWWEDYMSRRDKIT